MGPSWSRSVRGAIWLVLPLLVLVAAALDPLTASSALDRGSSAVERNCGKTSGDQVNAYNLTCDRARDIWKHPGHLPQGWTGANGDGITVLFPASRADHVYKALSLHGVNRRKLGSVALVAAKVPPDIHSAPDVGGSRRTAAHKCDDVQLAPHSDYLAVNIRARGVKCGPARKVVRDVAHDRSTTYQCSSRPGPDTGLSSSLIRCVEGRRLVKWKQY